MRNPVQIEITRAPDGDAGTGGTPGGSTPPVAATPPGDGQAPGGGGADPGAAAPYRPDGLPDHLFGASERETIDKLYGAYKPARDEIAKFGELGKLPKDAGGYEFQPSDKLKPYLPELDRDPVMKIVRETAFASGIRDKQFAPFIGALLEKLVDADFVAPPVDLAAEKAALVPADAGALDDAGKSAAVDRRIRDNHATIEMWKGRGLDPKSAEALAMTLDTLAGNKAIEFFSGQLKTAQPSTGGQGGGAVDKASLAARQQDPRGKVGDAKFDPGFAAETDRLYQATYGN